MSNNKSVIDYERLAEQESFKQLSKRKNVFLWTLTVVFLSLYMLLPILTSYTDILHQKAIGEITWVWLYSAFLFIMTWVLAHIYVSKANGFDRDAKSIIDEYQNGGAGR